MTDLTPEQVAQALEPLPLPQTTYSADADGRVLLYTAEHIRDYAAAEVEQAMIDVGLKYELRTLHTADQVRMAVLAMQDRAAIRGRLAQLENKVVDIEIRSIDIDSIIQGVGK